MPFDGTDFPQRKRPTPARPGEKLMCIMFIVGAFVLLVMPVSMAGLVDIVRYIQHH